MLAKGAEWLNRRRILYYENLNEYELKTEIADDVAEGFDAQSAGTGKDSGRLRERCNIKARHLQHQKKNIHIIGCYLTWRIFALEVI